MLWFYTVCRLCRTRMYLSYINYLLSFSYFGLNKKLAQPKRSKRFCVTYADRWYLQLQLNVNTEDIKLPEKYYFPQVYFILFLSSRKVFFNSAFKFFLVLFLVDSSVILRSPTQFYYLIPLVVHLLLSSFHQCFFLRRLSISSFLPTESVSSSLPFINVFFSPAAVHCLLSSYHQCSSSSVPFLLSHSYFSSSVCYPLFFL